MIILITGLATTKKKKKNDKNKKDKQIYIK